jgi:uncharacterized membrane protein
MRGKSVDKRRQMYMSMYVENAYIPAILISVMWRGSGLRIHRSLVGLTWVELTLAGLFRNPSVPGRT